MDYKALGKRIREERLKLNLTQEQLSESIDISNSYMGQIERGERSLTIDKLIRLSKRLGVTIDYLLQEYVNVNNDTFLNQVTQLMDGRNLKEKQMALDVLKIMFSHVDEL
ncbi:helix-turn-helix transcriptional regulator [Clostridium intestinale]|uniref:helix-turn-helix domain-containing protein n=1 Tax=Clostridium intestinale TaxID=36845 RepID=UPI002DD6478A|nr:helix-turn-helix transcriptional regulator [Clostridium intestinale]WRY50713.1 helix-turn-helix transcriptional regulator [Clostridium intestinale]